MEIVVYKKESNKHNIFDDLQNRMVDIVSNPMVIVVEY